MVNANELRIGNWVDFTGKEYYGKVLSINGETIQDNVYLECKESYEWAEWQRLTPIPLTQDILLKCGFEKQDIGYAIKNDPVGIFIDDRNRIREKKGLVIEDKRDGFFIETYYCYIEIKYLHQLQNLYFALIGTELEIKL